MGHETPKINSFWKKSSHRNHLSFYLLIHPYSYYIFITVFNNYLFNISTASGQFFPLTSAYGLTIKLQLCTAFSRILFFHLTVQRKNSFKEQTAFGAVFVGTRLTSVWLWHSYDYKGRIFTFTGVIRPFCVVVDLKRHLMIL